MQVGKIQKICRVGFGNEMKWKLNLFYVFMEAIMMLFSLSERVSVEAYSISL